MSDIERIKENPSNVLHQQPDLIKVLLIEDNPGDARLVQEMLVDVGANKFSLAHVGLISEGLALLRKEGYDVIMLDLSLPDGYGLDTVRQVCAVASHLPVVILTGLDDETIAIRAVQEGAQDYLVKGQMDSNLLARAIRYAIERKRVGEEKAALEEQLRQSQKIEAIGQLAGGVAHEFNNILTVIKGYSELSLCEIKDDSPLKMNIEEIHKASQMAADITGQLLAFTRRQILEMRVLDLNSIINDFKNMLKWVIGENIKLVTILASDVGRVKVDRGQIGQALVNLVVNARDAMPLRGKIVIETVNAELDEGYARFQMGIKPGRYVILSVSDTGTGMSPEVRERIFEPFFTTKEIGKGTGLGLSVVYGIVKQCAGSIWVYSELGQGTTFKIYLPRVDEVVENLDSSHHLHNKLLRGRENILLVEDEESVRVFIRSVLQSYGYTVLEAAHGDEALRAAYQNEGRKIHLLLTDVMMPGMNGLELAESLVHCRPEIKVLYMSGYTDAAIIHNDIAEPGIPFLQKPFSPDALARKVREVLER